MPVLVVHSLWDQEDVYGAPAGCAAGCTVKGTPLYDRNPQTFVESIFWAKPADFRKAEQRVHHAPGRASFVELPLVGGP